MRLSQYEVDRTYLLSAVCRKVSNNFRPICVVVSAVSPCMRSMSCHLVSLACLARYVRTISNAEARMMVQVMNLRCAASSPCDRRPHRQYKVQPTSRTPSLFHPAQQRKAKRQELTLFGIFLLFAARSSNSSLAWPPPLTLRLSMLSFSIVRRRTDADY